MDRMSSLRALVAAGVCAALAGPALAADTDRAGDTGVAERLEQMQAELERLRQDNLAMRDELQSLRLSTDDQWLTEQRESEIRSLISDVLADADTRSSLLSDGLTAGWRDGFFLGSPDGRFLLQLQGQMQFRYVYSYHDTEPGAQYPPAAQNVRHARGFENTRTRLTFRGHVFDQNLTYLVRGSFQRDATAAPQGGGFFLLDAFARYHLNDEWSIRAGQFRLPFSREYLVSSAYQLGVERSLIDTNMNLGRSQGVELTYANNVHRASLAYSDGARDNLGQDIGGGVGIGPGLGNSLPGHPPTNSAALLQGVEYAFTARYEFLAAGTWRQFEDFTSPMDEEFGLMIGVAAHIQRDQATGAANPFGLERATRWFGYTVDASAEFGGANLFGSFTHHYVDAPNNNVNIMGLVVHGGVYFTPKWEAFARYEFGTWDLDTIDFEDAHLVTLGVNYYLDGHDVKWTTDIGVGLSEIDQVWGAGSGGFPGWRFDPPDSDPQIVFRTQFQLLF